MLTLVASVGVDLNAGLTESNESASGLGSRFVNHGRPGAECGRVRTFHLSSNVVSEDLQAADSGHTLGPGALREASLTGVRWGSLTRLVSEAFTFGSSIVLAHLITPAEFGVAAVALGIAAIAPSVAGAGFGVPLVQMRSVDHAHIEAAMVLSVATGVGLTMVTIFVLCPLAIEPVFGARVAYLLRLVSPIFALAGIGTVPNALLQRALQFRRLSQIEITSLVTGPLVSISLAATTDFGAEAIVIGGLATAAVATVATVVSAPRVGLGWHRAHARDMAGIGFFAALTSLIGSLSRNVQYVIIGARLPARDVGVFWRAYQLAVDYQAKMGLITLRLAFPLFSRSGSLDEMRRLRERILQVQSIIIFPLLATLIVLAPELVPFLYGKNWSDAVFPVQVLAIAGMATIAASAGIGLAFAAGKARPLFFFNLAQLAGLVGVVTWTSSYGLRAVVIGLAAYQVVLVAAQFIYIESHEVGIPLRETWNALVPASVASSASLAVTYPIVRLIVPDVGDLAVVLLGGALSIGLYALVLRLAFPSRWFTVGRLLVALARPGAGEATKETPSESPDGPTEGRERIRSG
jgi:O-antigen/teichoic acid export membrane protein